MTVIPTAPVLLLLALVLFCAGVDLNALLPHLTAGLIIPGVALVGGLWMGAFDCALMGVASGIVDVLFHIKKGRRNGRLWTS